MLLPPKIKTAKLKALQTFSLLALLSAPLSLSAEKLSFDAWKQKIEKKATQKGLDEQQVKEALAPLTPNPKIIKFDRNQVHTKLSFAEYAHRVVPQSRLDTAVAKYKLHEDLLTTVGAKYGVQPRFIVALWAVESDFGRRMGDFSMIRSLSTLAYDGRREKFFTAELLNAFKILQQGHVTPANFVGSWAGAMGQCQFMPSSFLAYAQDFDGDGRKDIWGTKADVFASAANYLHKSGWNPRQTWGREVSQVPASIKSGTKKSLSQWAARGVLKADGAVLPQGQMLATLVRPARSDKTYLAYGNYQVIKKWNNSDYFALTVGQIADYIAQHKGQ